MNTFDHLFKSLTRPIVVVPYLMFCVLSFWYWDQPIAYFFHQYATQISVFNWVTHIGSNKLYLLGLLFLALLFRYGYRRRSWELCCWFLWLCVLIPNCVNGILKMLLGRARPELLFQSKPVYGFFGWQQDPAFWSFPSGHTTTIIGLTLGLVILFPRHRYFFMLLAIMIMTTRIILTQHFLSDVLATAFLGLIEIRLLTHYLQSNQYMRQKFNVNFMQLLGDQ